MAAGQADGVIEIRELSRLDELREAVRLQKEIWGFSDADMLPLRLFVVATKIGGNVLGAFDREHMVGFSIAIPGIKPGGRLYWHSNMMGVTAAYRNRGLGRALKLRQRECALRQGIDLIEWTFDPLELKNAYFNIERLGVIVRRYVLNQYGYTSSPLHGGLPTDRCVAEWHLTSTRVEKILAGEQDRPTPTRRISVPREISALRSQDPLRAREIQSSISRQFLQALDGGLAVTGFERTEQGGDYLLSPWPS